MEATTTPATLVDQLENREISVDEFVGLARLLSEDEMRRLLDVMLKRLVKQ